MPEGLIVPGSATALLALVVWLILRGLLVPRPVLRDVQADRDYWRETAMTALAQNAQLLEQGRVVSDVMRALPTPTESGESS